MQYQAVLKGALEPVLLLTGAAGCGKTVSVSLLKLYEGHSSKPCCIAALLLSLLL